MSSAADATAELCVERLDGVQAMTDVLSVAAQPSDRGPGDEFGSVSLASATLSGAFFRALYLCLGPLLERWYRVNPERLWGHQA